MVFMKLIKGMDFKIRFYKFTNKLSIKILTNKDFYVIIFLQSSPELYPQNKF